MPKNSSNTARKSITDTRAGTLDVSVFYFGGVTPGHYPAGYIPGNFPTHFSFTDTFLFGKRLAPGGRAEMNIHYVERD